MRYRFPDGFLWGSATAATQIEGAAAADGRGPSVWDRFCAEHPGRIHGAATPEVACDHYRRWREDVDWMRAMGHTAYRFSIAWPRLFPAGDGPFNPAGAAFYDRLIDALLEAGITPHATLYHWDLPEALAARGGWLDKSTIEAFLTYAERCFRLYGDRVARWSTLNEPGWSTLNGYVTGLHPPGRHDYGAAIQVAHNLLVAHARAVQRFRASGARGEIGIALNLSPIHPASADPRDQTAARLADGILNRWFLDPVLLGRYPADVLALYRAHGLLPEWDAEELLAFQEDSVDFLGVNYYYPHHASADAPETGFALNTSGEAADHCAFSIAGLFRFVRNPRGRFTRWDWEIDPDGLHALLTRAHAYRPGLPIDVTENGIGLVESPDAEGRIQDTARIDYLRDHLKAVHRAITEGVAVRGYFMWSLMDNFSWINGYRKRYGFLYVDRETLERRRKASSYWFAEVAANHGFDD
jgi:beta-galactosidase